MKQLQTKYDEAEIDQLIDEGAIEEVKHSKSGSVTMYLDHSDWAKTTHTTKARAFKSNMSKKMGPEDEEARFAINNNT